MSDVEALSVTGVPRPIDREGSGTLVIALTGLLFLAAACWPMQRHALPAWAAAALAAGLVAWAVIAGRFAGREELPAPSPAPADLRRLAAALVAAGLLATLAWTRTTSGQFETLGVTAWLGALALWFWGWGRRPPGTAPSPEHPTSHRHRLAVAAALLAILAIGAWFRFHELSLIPPHPGRDHAEDLLNVEDLAHGARPVFF